MIIAFLKKYDSKGKIILADLSELYSNNTVFP